MSAIEATAAIERARRFAAGNHANLVRRTGVVVEAANSNQLRYAVHGWDGIERYDVDLATLTKRPAEAAVAEQGPVPPGHIASPDGSRVAWVDDGDLWVRDLPDGVERQLTSATADVTFATPPDVVRVPLLARLAGLPDTPLLMWSPDGTRILTHRIDQAHVPLSHLVDRDEANRPRVHSYHFAQPGDPLPQCAMVVIDTSSGESVDLGPAIDADFLTPLHAQRAWWSSDSHTVWWVSGERGARALHLHAADARTGADQILYTERSETHLDLQPIFGATPQIRILESRGQFIWSSDRDGHRHLYLHDLATGALVRQLTSGAWVVRDIAGIDETNDSLLVFGSGREPGRNPYFQALYRVPLAGGEPTLLTLEDGDHHASWHAGAGVLVDTWSTFGTLPTTVLRDRDGHILAELEQADATPLLEAGFSFPEEFRVLAADGETELSGIIYKPSNFDDRLRYPVVDSVYPGPQGARQLRGSMHGFFVDPLLLDPTGSAAALAELGFVVIVMDGRGTPLRSRAFHHHSYGNLGSAGALDDHVSALQQLAETRPWMDLDRVGVIGHSGGGFAAARALLQYPDVFRVGVASAGNHDQAAYHAAWGETYHGIGGDVDWSSAANASLADRLAGKLFLVHGEMDDNVHPQHTMALVEALIRADKDFDLLLVPKAAHHYGWANDYVQRRQWEYLLTHLGSPRKEEHD